MYKSITNFSMLSIPPLRSDAKNWTELRFLPNPKITQIPRDWSRDGIAPFSEKTSTLPILAGRSLDTETIYQMLRNISKSRPRISTQRSLAPFPFSIRILGQNILNHIPMHVGQSVASALMLVGEFSVVDTKKV
jgi:hypothetical protein